MQVSVVIPTYNMESSITRTLDSLTKQTFRGSYEIVVVNDGSKDNTEAVVKEYAKKNSKIKLVSQKNAGPAAARNHGARVARGEILLFTDADCIVSPQWIHEMLKPFKDPEVIGVQGKYGIDNNLNKTIVARFVQYEIEERYQRTRKMKTIDFIGSYAAAYRRDTFLKFRGFDESFPRASGEDPELSYRMAKAGHKMVFAPAAIVYQEHPATLHAYARQKFWRGYWGVLLYKKHPDRAKGQSYNSSWYFAHIGVTCLLAALTVATSIVDLSLSATGLASMLVASFPSSLRLARFEKKFLLVGPFLVTKRAIATGAGIVAGYLAFRR